VEQTIDWKSAKKAMNKLPLAKQQWVSKAATKFLPDGEEHSMLGTTDSSQVPKMCLQKPSRISHQTVEEGPRGPGSLVANS